MHPRVEEEIGEGRWFVMVLIEPNPHVRQSLGQIVFVEERDFRRSHEPRLPNFSERTANAPVHDWFQTDLEF